MVCVRGYRQVLTVWFCLWSLLLAVVAGPYCHMPLAGAFLGQDGVLCHADGDRPTHPLEEGRGGDNTPSGDSNHCPLCFTNQLLSICVPALAPVSVPTKPVLLGILIAQSQVTSPRVWLAIGPQQPRAPPSWI